MAISIEALRDWIQGHRLQLELEMKEIAEDMRVVSDNHRQCSVKWSSSMHTKTKIIEIRH
jgi:hypothetical protein